MVMQGGQKRGVAHRCDGHADIFPVFLVPGGYIQEGVLSELNG